MSTWTPKMQAAGKRVRAQIYRLITDNPGISSSTIAGLLDMPIRTAAGHLATLSREGRIIVKIEGAPTAHRPRSTMTRIYPSASPAPRAVNRGGNWETPMLDDAEHREWMAYWKTRRTTRQAGVMAMRGRA